MAFPNFLTPGELIKLVAILGLERCGRIAAQAMGAAA